MQPHVCERYAAYFDYCVMECVGIAILAMIVATTASHLGLPQAIAKVMSKILGCHKCLSFWLTLTIMWYIDCPAIYAVSLSLLAAYASNWFVLVLIQLNKWYEELWQKLN